MNLKAMVSQAIKNHPDAASLEVDHAAIIFAHGDEVKAIKVNLPEDSFRNICLMIAAKGAKD